MDSEGPTLEQLSAKHRRFVSEYLVDFQAFPAAIRAGYSAKNTGIGTRLLQTPAVADEIIRRCLEMQIRLQVDGDDVRRGLALIATHPHGPEKGGPTWGDRIQAWRELGKLLGLYTNKIQVTGSLTLVDLLLAAERKIEQEALPPPSDYPAH